MKRTWIPLLIITLWVMPVKADMFKYADFTHSLSSLGSDDPCAMIAYFDYNQVRDAVPRLRTWYPFPWEPGANRDPMGPASLYRQKVGRWFQSSVLWLASTMQAWVVVGGRYVTDEELQTVYEYGGRPEYVNFDPRSLRAFRDQSIKEFKKLYAKDRNATNTKSICNITEALIYILQKDSLWFEAPPGSDISVFYNSYDIIGNKIPVRYRSECGCFANYERAKDILKDIDLAEQASWQTGYRYIIPVINENVFGYMDTQSMWPSGWPAER